MSRLKEVVTERELGTFNPKIIPEWKAIELYKKTNQKLTFFECLKKNGYRLSA